MGICGVLSVMFICCMVELIVGLMMLMIGFGKMFSLMIRIMSGVIVSILCGFRFFSFLMFFWIGLVIVCWYISRMYSVASMILRIVIIVIILCWLNVLVSIMNLGMNGDRLGSARLDRLVNRNVLVSIGVIFLILLKSVIWVDPRWEIRYLVIRNSVAVERSWLNMYSVDLVRFCDVSAKMFIMMKSKCEIDVYVISCLMSVCSIVSSALYSIEISVSIRTIGVVYWDAFGNRSR